MRKEENGVYTVSQRRTQVSKSVFKYMNKYYMVLAHRIGLFPWMLNPLTGYIMILKTRGCKSGKERCTPVNYAIVRGSLYCIAGFGKGTDWLANLKAYPTVEFDLAGTAFKGQAEIVTDRLEAQRAFLQIVHNCGFATLFLGLNPFTLTDEKILAKSGPEVVLRISPREIVSHLTVWQVRLLEAIRAAQQNRTSAHLPRFLDDATLAKSMSSSI